MNDENKNIEVESEAQSNEELKIAIEETLSNIRKQSMLLGAQSMCQVILDRINAFERTPGKKSNNDHKRLIKGIKNFCEVGLSNTVNVDGTTEENNTKLMEEDV